MGLRIKTIILIVVVCLGVTAMAQGKVVISVDATAQGKELKHVWSYYGYDECNVTTTKNGKELLKTLAQINSRPVYIRCHSLLNNGDGKIAPKWGSTNVYTEDAAGKPIYDWEIMDGIFDSITGSGCLPLVEIGFMPKPLSVNPANYDRVPPYPPDGGAPVDAGWAQPPKDYQKWRELIKAWARHSVERYENVKETWLWQLWNEPDIKYWLGTYEEFIKLFDYTEAAVHEVIPGAVFGGPHTAGTDEFMVRFLEHCANGKNHVTGKRGTRLDYIAFHAKGQTDMFEGHPRMNFGWNLNNCYKGYRAIAKFDKFRDVPIIIGECDPESMAARSARMYQPNSYRNLSAYAAYVTAIMKRNIDLAQREGVNLAGVLSWAFIFDGKDYFEGYRTLATNGIHKPVLNAFKMLGRLKGKRIPLTSSGALEMNEILSESVRDKADIDGLAVKSDDGVGVLVWNYHDEIVAAPAEKVRLVIKVGQDFGLARVSHYRIDENHSNAYTAWVGMGSPQKPTAEMLGRLKKAGELETLEPARVCNVSDGEIMLDFSLPRHGVSLIEVQRVR